MRAFRLLPVLFLILCPLGCFGSTILLGSIATNNVAVLGFDNLFPNSASVLVNLLGTNPHINVTGNVVSNSVGSGLTFVSGSAVTSGGVLTSAQSDFTSVTNQLAAQTYTPLTITSGAVNTFATPGNYSLSIGTLNAGTVINLTGAGQYIFKVPAAFNWTGVTVNAVNGSLSSDSVFWYTTAQVSITDSNVFGDVVQASGASDQIRADGANGSLTGRFLSGGFFTTLEASGHTLTILDQNSPSSPTPEPSTFAFLLLGLGLGAAALRQRKS